MISYFPPAHTLCHLIKKYLIILQPQRNVTQWQPGRDGGRFILKPACKEKEGGRKAQAKVKNSIPLNFCLKKNPPSAGIAARRSL